MILIALIFGSLKIKKIEIRVRIAIGRREDETLFSTVINISKSPSLPPSTNTSPFPLPKKRL